MVRTVSSQPPENIPDLRGPTRRPPRRGRIQVSRQLVEKPGPVPQVLLPPRLLRDDRERYPRVSIHLEERTPERVWEMLAKGRLSAAFTRPVRSVGETGLRTLLVREERLGAVVPLTHPLAKVRRLTWKHLTPEPLVVLARREGVSLYDAMLTSCRQAGFSPRLAYTPSLIGTVLGYVEAGVGVGIIPESVSSPSPGLKFGLLHPVAAVQLVLVWPEKEDTPAVQRFRELVREWLAANKLWPRPGRRVV
jgi:DNA-binding transcriptional LysR family regulator